MPTISMFYGIIIRMMFFDTKQHHLPHIHVEYQGEKATFTIPDGELLADWTLAVNGEPVFQIKPLQ